PSTPASAISMLVPAPSRRYGISRSAQPAIVRSIASTRPDSTKNSAGPPIPKDVRVARGSSWLTPGSARSQSRLDFLRQLIAQLLANVAGSHQQEHVVRSNQVLEHLARVLDVVAAALAQVDAPDRTSAVMDGGRSRLVAAVVGAFVEAVRDLAGRRRQRARTSVVGAQHGQAVGRQLADELGEQRLHRLDV